MARATRRAPNPAPGVHQASDSGSSGRCPDFGSGTGLMNWQVRPLGTARNVGQGFPPECRFPDCRIPGHTEGHTEGHSEGRGRSGRPDAAPNFGSATGLRNWQERPLDTARHAGQGFPPECRFPDCHSPAIRKAIQKAIRKEEAGLEGRTLPQKRCSPATAISAGFGRVPSTCEKSAFSFRNSFATERSRPSPCPGEAGHEDMLESRALATYFPDCRTRISCP